VHQGSRHIIGANVALAAIALLTLAATPVKAAELPRDHIVLKSAIAVDPQQNTVVLPLYKGNAAGKIVYYILADSSSKTQAQELGLNYAPSIDKTYTQSGSGSPQGLTFAGAPVFSAGRVYIPSANGFPPVEAKPGSTADDSYSPFVKLADGTTLDAPIVATGSAPFDVTTHRNTADRVLAIDTNKKTVTILLAHGFFNGARVVYLSTDASDPGVDVHKASCRIRSSVATTNRRARQRSDRGEQPASPRPCVPRARRPTVRSSRYLGQRRIRLAAEHPRDVLGWPRRGRLHAPVGSKCRRVV
jgi:hypothetical protein